MPKSSPRTALVHGAEIHLWMHDLPLPARDLPAHSEDRARAQWSVGTVTVTKVGGAWAYADDGRPGWGVKIALDPRRNTDRWKHEYKLVEVCPPAELAGRVWMAAHRHEIVEAVAKSVDPRIFAEIAALIGFSAEPPASIRKVAVCDLTAGGSPGGSLDAIGVPSEQNAIRSQERS